MNFNRSHAEALYVRFCAIYGDKFFKPYHDSDFKLIWYEEWASSLENIDVSLIKGVLETCKETFEWPPSIAEFIKLCEHASGVPSFGECFAAAIRGDFSHPLTVMSYDKVGSWAMKNSKESELLPKFKLAYQEAINVFRVDPESGWNQLEEFKERKALPEPPPKIPSSAEIISWRERLARYQEMAKADKAKLEAKDHPVWDKNKITRGARNYDESYYNERKRYLIGVDEIMAGTLPREDWYDRTRYLREIEASSKVEQFRRDNPTREEKVSPRGYNQARKVYKSWSD